LTTIESLHDAFEDDALSAEDVSAQTVQQSQPTDIRPERATRRRLSPEQQREVARLYADSAIPTSEIRKRFGIGESSLYRIVQRQGVPLRGRAAATQEPVPSRAQATSVQRRVPAVATGVSRAGRRGRVSQATSSADGRASAPGSGGRRQFRIQFQAERVIQAQDIWDALRQAESFGAIEVTALTRTD